MKTRRRCRKKEVENHRFNTDSQYKSTNTVMLRYTRISQQSGASTLASLRYACGWVRLTGKQSTMKDSLVDRITYVLWRCTEGVRKQGVIQAFHRIQSVKSTNRVMLCYTRAKSSQCVNVGVAEHRQATHEHMSNVDINGQARSQHKHMN